MITHDFNPRPREEGDIVSVEDISTEGDFNPRPREEGDIVSVEDISTEGDFNPRPREEGDFAKALTSLTLTISIHALVKRATIGRFTCFGNYSISIHALVKRATLNRQLTIEKSRDFNPRPREEGDSIPQVR